MDRRDPKPKLVKGQFFSSVQAVTFWPAKQCGVLLRKADDLEKELRSRPFGRAVFCKGFALSNKYEMGGFTPVLEGVDKYSLRRDWLLILRYTLRPRDGGPNVSGRACLDLRGFDAFVELNADGSPNDASVMALSELRAVLEGCCSCTAMALALAPYSLRSMKSRLQRLVRGEFRDGWATGPFSIEPDYEESAPVMQGVSDCNAIFVQERMRDADIIFTQSMRVGFDENVKLYNLCFDDDTWGRSWGAQEELLTEAEGLRYCLEKIATVCPLYSGAWSEFALPVFKPELYS